MDIGQYEVQYSIAGTKDWHSIGDDLLGLPKHSNFLEVQTVTIQADPGEMITSGDFRLSFSKRGVTARDIEQVTETSWISHVATEMQMKSALEALENINSVRVSRTGPDIQGGYSWAITFDDVPESELYQGNLPSLVVWAKTINAPWTGLSDQITIRKTRRGTTGPTTCVSDCSTIITGAETKTSYIVRLRANGTNAGWSPWGIVSDVLRTCQLEKPGPPQGLCLSSISQNHITVKWKTDTYLWDLPVLHFELQQKCHHDTLWHTIHNRIKPLPLWTTGTSAALTPNTNCM